MTDQPADFQSTTSFITASEATEYVHYGKASSLTDVRTYVECNSARVGESTLTPLELGGRYVDQIKSIDGPQIHWARLCGRRSPTLGCLGTASANPNSKRMFGHRAQQSAS